MLQDDWHAMVLLVGQNLKGGTVPCAQVQRRLPWSLQGELAGRQLGVEARLVPARRVVVAQPNKRWLARWK
ncbi:MAG: hypothetical protein JXM73_26305 [Anaerolineae bacterium]|nr:hypothetical protein [Anaerolineae bacterium]